MGGQVDPSSIVGEYLVWKNAQRNDTKNKISETMDTIIPQRRPIFCYLCVQTSMCSFPG